MYSNAAFSIFVIENKAIIGQVELLICHVFVIDLVTREDKLMAV